MIDLLLLAAARQGGARSYEPPPELLYHQAVSCAASLKLAPARSPARSEFARPR